MHLQQHESGIHIECAVTGVAEVRFSACGMAAGEIEPRGVGAWLADVTRVVSVKRRVWIEVIGASRAGTSRAEP